MTYHSIARPTLDAYALSKGHLEWKDARIVIDVSSFEQEAETSDEGAKLLLNTVEATDLLKMLTNNLAVVARLNQSLLPDKANATLADVELYMRMECSLAEKVDPRIVDDSAELNYYYKGLLCTLKKTASQKDFKFLCR